MAYSTSNFTGRPVAGSVSIFTSIIDLVVLMDDEVSVGAQLSQQTGQASRRCGEALSRLCDSSKQHRVSSNVFVDARLQASVGNEVDLPTQDPLNQKFEPDKLE